MYDVFISYAREEEQIARALKAGLESNGYEVFLDIDHLTPGADFSEGLDRALNDCAAVVGIWSRLSLSKRWVRGECRLALERGKLVPVSYEKLTSTDLPAEFQSVHIARLSGGSRGESDLAQLMSAIRGLVQQRRREQILEAEGRQDGVRPARVYLSDAGARAETIADIARRLAEAGFEVSLPHRNPYMAVDTEQAFYKAFDFGIIVEGAEIGVKHSNSELERKELRATITVCVEPVDFRVSGYGADALGLGLQDWSINPEGCAQRLTVAVRDWWIKEQAKRDEWRALSDVQLLWRGPWWKSHAPELYFDVALGLERAGIRVRGFDPTKLRAPTFESPLSGVRNVPKRPLVLLPGQSAPDSVRTCAKVSAWLLDGDSWRSAVKSGWISHVDFAISLIPRMRWPDWVDEDRRVELVPAPFMPVHASPEWSTFVARVRRKMSDARYRN